MRTILVSIFAALVFAGIVLSQAPTAAITGSVVDSSGGLVAGANVTAINTATNLQRSTATNESGLFDLPALPPGIYDVKVEKSGFQAQMQRGIEIQVSQVARLEITLKVGNVTETVEVAALAPNLDTETTSVGTVIENRRIVELPLNGRNYLQLASLIPGATTLGPASSQGQQRMGGARNAFALNIAGQRVHYNHYSLDGMENTDTNFNTYLFLPSVDALQEFKVESGLFSAEYGRAIAQVNVTTKSGTNQFHGTAFEFLRNHTLDAKNFFDRASDPIPPFKRNQFGGTVGGPIIKNRLFFMGNYEGLRERKALTLTGTMPPANYRTGDFSFLLPRQIRDPFTGIPYPNNIIPASQIHPTSAKVLKDFFPLPNRGRHRSPTTISITKAAAPTETSSPCAATGTRPWARICSSASARRRNPNTFRAAPVRRPTWATTSTFLRSKGSSGTRPCSAATK